MAHISHLSGCSRCEFRLLRSASLVVMMQPTEVGDRHDAPVALHVAPLWCIELQRLMTPMLVVVRHVLAKQPTQVPFGEYDDADECPHCKPESSRLSVCLS